ncbi:MAG: response regulator [Oscillospiraceae bacterium]
MPHKIEVVLAEDGAALRRMLVDHLNAQPDIRVVGEAADGQALVALCRAAPPDVAVVDIRMPHTNGLHAARTLRAELPAIKLLILTTFDDEDYLRELFGIGVDGYLLKADAPPRLDEAIRNVYRGLGAIDAGVSRKLGELLAGGKAPGPAALTGAEQQVARLICQGKYNKDIAVALHITYGHARNLVSGVYHKMGAIDRADLRDKLERAYQAGAEEDGP